MDDEQTRQSIAQARLRQDLDHLDEVLSEAERLRIAITERLTAQRVYQQQYLSSGGKRTRSTR